MADENQIPLTPQEREERIKNLMIIMKTGGIIPEEIFVGLTAEQKVQLEEHQNKFNLCIERILEKKEGILGKLDERARKVVMPKVIEDLLSQMPNTSEDVEQVVYQSLKKRGLEYFEQRRRQQVSSCQIERPRAWYSQIDLHGFAHSLISDDDSMRRLHDFFPDDEIMIRTQIADKIVNEIISKDSKTEQDARQLGREIISDAREQYSHLTESKIDMPAVENVDTRRVWYNNPSQEALLRTVRNLILSGGPYTSPVSEDTSIHEQIASSARSMLKQYPPKSEDEYRKIVRTTAERFLQPFIAKPETEPSKVEGFVEDTRKEEPVARKYLNKKTFERAAIGGLGALLLAGGIWLFTRESGLEERVSETEIAAIEEIKTSYVEKTIVPENTAVQKPIDEAIKEDYGADILPAEVKPEPVISVQDDKKIVLDEDKPLPEIYVPVSAVPKEMRKEISKETFEAMYVLARTKIQEKIDNYVGLWNQFFQHTQTPVQVIPVIPAQVQEQTQEQIPQVHESRRLHAKKTANVRQYSTLTPYVSANVSALMPIGSNIYNKGEIALGFSAGIVNQNGLEFNLGADFFNSKANGKENGTEWSADSEYMLVNLGFRKNLAKQGAARTYWGVELDSLIANSRFTVGGDYGIDETNSSITYGLGLSAGVNVGKIDFKVRGIHLFGDSVSDIIGLSMGCKF